jgi:hypothetical protein
LFCWFCPSEAGQYTNQQAREERRTKAAYKLHLHLNNRIKMCLLLFFPFPLLWVIFFVDVPERSWKRRMRDEGDETRRDPAKRQPKDHQQRTDKTTRLSLILDVDV